MRMMGRRWTGRVMQSVMLTSDGSGLHAGLSDDIVAVNGSSQGGWALIQAYAAAREGVRPGFR
jgi:hypothetical protein